MRPLAPALIAATLITGAASADPGSLSKKGEANTMGAIDGCLLALTLGATFVARSFSGDKAQLVPILKAGLAHRGFAFVDVISPCVTFNDHEGSTKSYAHTREKNVEVVQADFVLPTSAITTAYERARFGLSLPTEDELREVERCLTVLERR